MYVKVRVSPGSKQEKVAKQADNYFEMQVKEPAERNLANKRVQAILATEYRVSDKSVRIISGHRSPIKIFDVIIN